MEYFTVIHAEIWKDRWKFYGKIEKISFPVHEEPMGEWKALLIFNPDTRWRWEVSFIIRPLYTGEGPG